VIRAQLALPEQLVLLEQQELLVLLAQLVQPVIQDPQDQPVLLVIQDSRDRPVLLEQPE
jgi:hypothetical protein